MKTLLQKQGKTMRIIIDIDGVIASYPKDITTYPDELFPEIFSTAVPSDGCKEAIEKLRELGYEVILHTSRWKEDEELTREWLERYEIPYDDIIFDKPQGDLYVDDRAFKFTDWPSLLAQIKQSTIPASLHIVKKNEVSGWISYIAYLSDESIGVDKLTYDKLSTLRGWMKVSYSGDKKVSSTVQGEFLTDPDLKMEALQLIETVWRK